MDNTKKILEMFCALDNLSNVNRFSLWCRMKEMNVAEHSFRVAVLSMLITDIYNAKRELTAIDMECVLRRALLHDFEESISGDISYTTKNYDSETSKFFSLLEKKIINKELFNENESYKNYVIQAKEGIEGKIIVMADMLDVSLYAYREITMGNVSHFKLLLRSNKYLFDIVDNEDFDFVYDAAKELENSARKLFPSQCEIYERMMEV